jgi:DNA repair protein RecN (Recombination protein N)
MYKGSKTHCGQSSSFVLSKEIELWNKVSKDTASWESAARETMASSIMLKQLHISNFALIDELEIEFGRGFTVLTGQTGAGKSIIIGALHMILGERADTDMIRHGEAKAVVEAWVDISGHEAIQRFLKAEELEASDNTLILRREIRSSGSRAFINDSPVTVGQMRHIGNQLVDLHGQHDHQLLLHEEEQRGLLDQLGDVPLARREYQEAYQETQRTYQEYTQAIKQKDSANQRLQLIQFQHKELTDAALYAEEEEELRAEMNRLDKFEDLQLKAGQIVGIGQDEGSGVLEQLRKLKQILRELNDLDPQFETYLEECTSAQVSLQELFDFAEQYVDTLEFNPSRLEECRQRYATLQKLEKKYALPIPELLDYRDKIGEEIASFSSSEERIERLEEALDDAKIRLGEKALALHDARVHEGEKTARAIEQTLHAVGIPDGELEIECSWLTQDGFEINAASLSKPKHFAGPQTLHCVDYGAESVRILIRTNKGEALKPLAKIASGGEISRIMLAIKSILVEQQSLPVMIFDEIDTGISGGISEKVGRKMREMSRHCQILAITHQAQIACQADLHLRVWKQEVDDRMVSTLEPLSHEGQIMELASLLGGEQTSSQSKELATEMLNAAQKEIQPLT